MLRLILCQRTVTIFQCAATVNNARPLHAGTGGGGGRWGQRGYLPGALWKDCERIRGRPGEVMSALKMSPPGPRTPRFGLATLKSKTRHTHA